MKNNKHLTAQEVEDLATKRVNEVLNNQGFQQFIKNTERQIANLQKENNELKSLYQLIYNKNLKNDKA